MTSNASQPWKSRLAEIALIFAAFFVQGAWPVPDNNEPYYLGKAIHYWNPDWVRGDFFLDTKDAHVTFYFTFGWLALWLTPTALAWVGRVLTWGLLAWSWRRLSWAIVPRTGFAALSGVLFACLVERCHMSGEWVIGGVEAKGFAFALMFLGLEALVRDRWNRAWLLFGAASFFHVLVGGWACLATAFAWLWLGRQRPALRSMLPGIVGGFLLSLPALIPSLLLSWGTDPETVRRAHEIYVYYRLPHHLILQEREPRFILRFAVLILAWGLLGRLVREHGPELRLRAFVVGTLGIGLIGAVISLLSVFHPELVAAVLRFYWFRMADVAVPMGLALLGALVIDRLLSTKPRLGWLGLAAAASVIAFHLGACALDRLGPSIPRSDAKVHKLGTYAAWRDACLWIADSGRIPKDARFLTPIDCQTFKWLAERPEVVTRKEVPQDAKSLVEWWDRLRDIHGVEGEDPTKRYWFGSLTELGAARLKHLGEKYQADYVLTEAPGRKLPETSAREAITAPQLPLEIVYKNEGYIIYRLQNGS